jgi:hypothetical protein
MKKSAGIIFVLSGLVCISTAVGYSQVTAASQKLETKQVDVNKDGKPDVTYYHDDKEIKKVEADTNFDGKPDVTIHTKDGKFESAEADTDYDGKADKKFNNDKEFKEWLNRDNQAFKDSLGWSDWSLGKIKF